MATKKSRKVQSKSGFRRHLPWIVVGAVAIAIAATLYASVPAIAPTAAPDTIVARSKGNATAAVTVEDWGDFQ